MRQQTIPQSQRLTAADADRRIDLDWVRIGAFGLLILYHVGMLYVSWGFHIKSDHRITALEPLMLMLNPWRLSLLFLVAGFATRFMFRKYATPALLQSRTARLLVPLAFGMLVIVPPQAYLQIVESLGYPAGFLDFYQSHYFAFGEQFCRPGPCIVLPTWNHLWFVAYLWVYTMALGGVLLVAPRLLDRVEQPLGKLLSGSLLLALPPLVLGLYRLILQPMYPSTHALFGDWYNHALFGTVFVIGFLLARVDGFWVAVERQRWSALSLAAVIFLTILGVRWWRLSGYSLPELLRIYAAMAYGAFQWLCMVAVLGFAKRWLTADSPARRYLTDAVFPYYIVHQTAIIIIAHALYGSGLPAWLEATIVVAGTAAACVLTFEVLRRVALLRPLFGLQMNPPRALFTLPPASAASGGEGRRTSRKRWPAGWGAR
jgi:hypothetical protein